MNDLKERLEQAHAPGHSLIKDWLVILLLVLVLGIATALGFCAFLDTKHTAGTLNREVGGVTSITFDKSTTTSPLQARGRWWATQANKLIPRVAQEEVTGAAVMLDDGIAQLAGGKPDVWWNQRMSVNLRNFMPTLMVRLEIIIVTFVAFLGFAAVGFFIGERYARLAMRCGRRKSDHRHAWSFLPVKILVFCIWVLAFCPIMPPVVYWIGFAYLLTAAGIAWVRANTIEI